MNLKNKIGKKWCKWCKLLDYKYFIYKNGARMVQEWCKGKIEVYYGEGEGGGSYCWCCDMAFSLKVNNICKLFLLFIAKLSYFVIVMKKEHPSMKHVESHTTFPIGYEFRSNGELLRCVERPDVSCWRDACMGCYFGINNLTCPKSQCSSFGRNDGKNVWFVVVSE